MLKSAACPGLFVSKNRPRNLDRLGQCVVPGTDGRKPRLNPGAGLRRNNDAGWLPGRAGLLVEL